LKQVLQGCTCDNHYFSIKSQNIVKICGDMRQVAKSETVVVAIRYEH